MPRLIRLYGGWSLATTATRSIRSSQRTS